MHTGGRRPAVLPRHFCNLSDRQRTGKAAGRIARKCHRHEEFAAASVTEDACCKRHDGSSFSSWTHHALAMRRHFRQTFWRMLSQLIT